MKEKYTISIADIQLNILSDEPQEYVRSTVAQLDQLIRDLTEKNRRSSKLDAALLCALDSISEKKSHCKTLRTPRIIFIPISLEDFHKAIWFFLNKRFMRTVYTYSIRPIDSADRVITSKAST